MMRKRRRSPPGKRAADVNIFFERVPCYAGHSFYLEDREEMSKKAEILETFKHINYVYNNASMYETLERMLNELEEECKQKPYQQEEKDGLNYIIMWVGEHYITIDRANDSEFYDRDSNTVTLDLDHLHDILQDFAMLLKKEDKNDKCKDKD